MKTFDDNSGHTWELELTLGSVKQVEKLLEINLLALHEGDPPMITRLALDVMFVADLIFALVKPQADEANVTDEQFAFLLSGEAFLAAQTALYEELMLFFLYLKRPDKVKTIQIQKAMIAEAVAQVEVKIEAIDTKKTVTGILGKQFSNLPESLVLTPTP